MEYTKTNVLLSAKNVGLSFGDKVVLRDINFEIKDIVRPNVTQGQVVSLVGRSGMGKSMLIRTLAGLPINGGTKHGEVRIDVGQSLVKEGDVSIVPQDYYLPEHLKVEQCLFKSAVKNPQFKGDQKVIKDAINEYVNAFELSEHRSKYPIQLSGGQRQRASISMQLLNGSNFLLMDEPFSGLDPMMIDKTTNLLIRVSLTDELKTIVIVSHDLSNCIAISDTVYVMSKKDGEGATLVREIDLIDRGLAWHPDIKRLQGFHDTINEVKSLL